MEWFQAERGITSDTLERYGVRVEGTNVVFPYQSGLRFRTDPYGKNRRFYWSPGSSTSLFVVPEDDPVPTAFLVEGETDTMRLQQELGRTARVYGLPGIETWKDEWAEQFLDYDKVYVILDNDSDYNVKARVDAAWKAIRSSIGRGRVARLHLPSTVKDICEFFDEYNLDVLRELAAHRPSSRRYKSLDLTLPPPPVRWLVDGLICRGDVTLLMGDPGLGKSWLTMSLAANVALKTNEWLGLRLYPGSGRTLYVDEENPVDVVYHRFQKLGVNQEASRDIRYLYRQGVWLDRDGDDLLDEAAEYGPELIVIDAFARVHSEDENSASAMATLFRKAITPLARETGAAVVVIHHSNKSDDGNSYRRARGSGDITASVDAAIDVRSNAGGILLNLYKSRRGASGQHRQVQIHEEGGRVTLVPREYEPLNF